MTNYELYKEYLVKCNVTNVISNSEISIRHYFDKDFNVNTFIIQSINDSEKILQIDYYERENEFIINSFNFNSESIHKIDEWDKLDLMAKTLKLIEDDIKLEDFTKGVGSWLIKNNLELIK